jgi:1-acyl-sn-glycerol-3-phosphate acyltransferase
MIRPFRQLEMRPVYGFCHYAFVTLHSMFFRGDVSGVENIPSTGPFLLAGNHASHLDPPAIGSNVPRQIAFFRPQDPMEGRPHKLVDGTGRLYPG